MVVPGLSTPILPRRVRPASPAWPRLLGGLLLALLAAHGRVDAADDFNPPLLEVESGPWAKASVVAVVAIRDIRQNRQVALGPMLVRAQVERVLKRPEPPPGQTGIKAGDPVIAWVPGPKPTLDPRAPSAPMLAAEDRGRYVLFLSDSSSGSAYEVQALFTADGLEGEQKVEALSRLQVQAFDEGPRGTGPRDARAAVPRVRRRAPLDARERGPRDGLDRATPPEPPRRGRAAAPPTRRRGSDESPAGDVPRDGVGRSRCQPASAGSPRTGVGIGALAERLRAGGGRQGPGTPARDAPHGGAGRGTGRRLGGPALGLVARPGRGSRGVAPRLAAARSSRRRHGVARALRARGEPARARGPRPRGRPFTPRRGRALAGGAP